jgi:hypothetical protein
MRKRNIPTFASYAKDSLLIITGELSTGADGLSHLPMTDNIPPNLVSEIYAINKLNNDTNFDFPLAMSLLKEEQRKDNKIQEALCKHTSNDRFGTLEFGDTSVHTIDGKIIVPVNLKSASSNGTTPIFDTPESHKPSILSLNPSTGKEFVDKSKTT